MLSHTKTATLISFHITLKMSLNSTSLSEIARIIVTDACPPEFPPVSINIGIKATNPVIPASFASKLSIIVPVIVARYH